MPSPIKPKALKGEDANPTLQGQVDVAASPEAATVEVQVNPHDDGNTKTPETQPEQPLADASMRSTPEPLSPFDWEDFEARYQEALREADEEERRILKEAEGLSKTQYFRSWAAAATVYDDERAAKRIQTRRRYVNLSEEKLSQKQQHYEEVVRAFESALALLRSR